MRATLEVLMDGLIDYAGLFPPASLDMGTAVERYAIGRDGESGWWLGRFVVPAARLEEFAQTHEASRRRRSTVDPPWQLAVLVQNDLAGDLSAIMDFNADDSHPKKLAVVDALETTVDSPEAVRRATKQMPAGIARYFEIPIEEDPSPFLVAIGQVGARAKVRTGGVDRTLFPSAQNLARFLVACGSAGVGFKATAGLHHPLRAVHRLTYEPNSSETLMHGFLNVFLAAGFAKDGMDLDLLIRLLEDDSPGAFTLGDDRAVWRGHELAIDRIREVRQEFAIAFGSCSIDEPRQGLREIGLL